jgi:hypothetical protein
MSRKLDAAIAEMLYDVRIGKSSAGGDMWLIDRPLRHTYNTQGSKWMTYPLPHYSSDGNAMLELDREMRGRGWMLEIYFADASDEYVVDYEKPNEDIFYSGLADTMPKAVALAAYHALTGKEWTE